MGQRQLICLARALLRRTKVVLYDEPVMNIDMETEQLIQSAVRREFDDSTVITVASKASTIAHCDRYVVITLYTVIGT